LFAISENNSRASNSIVQSDFAKKLPSGTYVCNPEKPHFWNDSIQIHDNTLIVYKTPKYGYGQIFTFSYSYKQLSKEEIVLTALSMKPEGVFVLQEQYDWHRDTLGIRFSVDSTIQLIGPQSEEYTLRSIKSDLR
jgi:hypothetical protein